MRKIKAVTKSFEFGLVDKENQTVSDKLTLHMEKEMYESEYYPNTYILARGTVLSSETDVFETPMNLSYLGGCELTLDSITGDTKCVLVGEKIGFEVTPCEGTDMKIFNHKKKIIEDVLRNHTLISGTVGYETISDFKPIKPEVKPSKVEVFLSDFEFKEYDEDGNELGSLILNCTLPLVRCKENPQNLVSAVGIVINGVSDDYDTPVLLSYNSNIKATIDSTTGVMTTVHLSEEKGFRVLQTFGTDSEIFNDKAHVIESMLRNYELTGAKINYEAIGGFNE